MSSNSSSTIELENRIGPLLANLPKEDPDEIWEDISGFEGKYQISHTGKVRRVFKRSVVVLKPADSFGGKKTNNITYRYTLTLRKKSFTISDKQLMAMTFVCPKPSAEHEAVFKDTSKPLSPSNVMWRLITFSSMADKIVCPKGHLLTEDNYYPTVYKRTGHKRCKICHRVSVRANAKRTRMKKKII